MRTTSYLEGYPVLDPFTGSLKSLLILSKTVHYGTPPLLGRAIAGDEVELYDGTRGERMLGNVEHLDGK